MGKLVMLTLFIEVVGVSSQPTIPPMVCKLVENEAIEKKAVDAVCSKQKMVPAAECEMALAKVWDALAKKECSNNTLAAIPPMVCRLVKNEAIEKRAVDAVCSKQNKVPAAECEMALAKIWDALAKKECSKTTLAAIPPAVCKLVNNEVVEKKAVDAVCSKQKMVPAAECEIALAKVWEALAKKECSKTTLAAIPPAVCKLVKNEAIEKRAVDAVCSKQKMVPAAECEMALAKVWEALAKKECSKTTLAAIPPAVCKLVNNEVVEKNAVDAVCSKQKMVPAAECEMALAKIWDALAKKECSNNALAAIPPMVCKLVKNEAIEKKAADAVCSKQKMVPAAECEMALTKMWDALAKRECSNSTVDVPKGTGETAIVV